MSIAPVSEASTFLDTGLPLFGELSYKVREMSPETIRYGRKERRLGANKVPLAQLLVKSDVFSIHVPLTDLTRGMIGAREIARMKPGALLINCARGAVLDTRAAARALEEGRLGGAGVDVFDPEVPPLDHPLLKCANAILSPHNAAQTAEARLNYAAVALDLLRVLDGKAPFYPAN